MGLANRKLARSGGDPLTWWRSMERCVPPHRPPAVLEVNTADVLEILTPIWHVKAPTAREVRQRIRLVLNWSIAMDLCNHNPCDLRMLAVSYCCDYS